MAVVNHTFELIKGYHTGKKGSYVTVKNNCFPEHSSIIKIKVNSIKDVEFVGNVDVPTEEPTQVVETVAEAMARIQNRFQILDEMAGACATGHIRALIVTGPPGVGKSHGVFEQMNNTVLSNGKKPRYEVVKGVASGIGLYTTLYQFSDPNCVVILDDCDCWSDPDALNILKGALDSGKSRKISWNKDSRKLRDEDIPNSFEFRGSVIFITNAYVANSGKNLIKAHLEALQSRAHYLDLTINTMRDKMLRIRQVHQDSNLFSDRMLTEEQGDMVIDFMEENKDKLREVSLRMALKIADLMKVSPSNWENLAKATCMV